MALSPNTSGIARGQGSQPRRIGRTSAVISLVVLAIACLVLSGCGSSKPSYCSSITKLESSIKALPTSDIIKNGTSGLKSAATKVQDDAQTVVSDAKSDFPTETSALQTAVTGLSTTVKQLTTSPSASTIGQLATQVSAVGIAVKNFTNATSSKCS